MHAKDAETKFAMIFALPDTHNGDPVEETLKVFLFQKGKFIKENFKRVIYECLNLSDFDKICVNRFALISYAQKTKKNSGKAVLVTFLGFKVRRSYTRFGFSAIYPKSPYE